MLEEGKVERVKVILAWVSFPRQIGLLALLSYVTLISRGKSDKEKPVVEERVVLKSRGFSGRFLK